jgi:hypothetical protein
MSQIDTEQELEVAKARTHIIKFGDQDWRVTPLHCVVGPIKRPTFEVIGHFWNAHAPQARSAILTVGPFTYPLEIRVDLEHQGWRSYPFPVLFFTNDPLVVNEMRLGEVSLAVVENGKIVLTNFLDLPGIEDAIKIYHLGEFWLSYAEGGTERRLRFGKENK